MDTSGFAETQQIVKVTADGAERFYRISSEGIKTSANIVKEIGKIMLFLAKQTKNVINGAQAGRRQTDRNQAGETPAMQLATSSKHGVLGVSILAENEAEYARYAAEHNIPFAVLYRRDNERYIIYPADRYKDVKEFMESASGRTVSLQTFQKDVPQMSYTPGISYADIDEYEIDSVDKKTDTVQLRLADDSGSIFVPAQDIVKVEDGEKLRVKLRSDMSYTLLSNPSKRINGTEAAELLKDSRTRIQEKLRADISRLQFKGSIDSGTAAYLSKDPVSHKRAIDRMVKRAELGAETSRGGHVTVFRAGGRKKVIGLSGNETMKTQTLRKGLAR